MREFTNKAGGKHKYRQTEAGKGIHMRLLIFGTGMITSDTLGQIGRMPESVEIAGFLDNDPHRWGDFMGKKVFSPCALQQMEYDKIIIMPDSYYEEIKENLVYWHHIKEEKIAGRNYLLKLLLLDKYKNSEDREIRQLLEYWEENEVSVFNRYLEDDKECYQVEWDYMENMPYIVFEEKRMYFPYDTRFEIKDGNKVVSGLLSEQQPSSPHLYIKDDICVEQGDVIADAGVCEGNFILRYIEKVSKAYLFEGDPRWIRPLQLTFEKFKDKVVLCDQFLGQCRGPGCTNLDTVVDGRLDFLKMDIEGAETGALLGGRNVLIRNNVKCAVCSYHQSGDEAAVRDILGSYGYKTDTSEGYMLFYHDSRIFSSLDLRRGVVYAKK